MTAYENLGAQPLPDDPANPARMVCMAIGAAAVVAMRGTGIDAAPIAVDGIAAAEAGDLHRAALAGERPDAEAIPLEWDGREIGVVYIVRDPNQGPADPKHDALIETFARHLAISIAYVDLGPRPQAEDDGMEAFATVDELTSRTWTLAQLSARLGEIAASATGATGAAIALWDEQRGILHFLPGSYGASERASLSYQVPTSEIRSNAVRVFRTGRPYLSNDARADPGVLQPYAEAFEITNLLSVPLNTGMRSIGVLHLANKPTGFTMDDVAVAEKLAPKIALAVEMRRSMLAVHAQQRLESALVAAAVKIAGGAGAREWVFPALEEMGLAADARMMALSFPDQEAPMLWQSGPVDEVLEADFLAAGTIARAAVAADNSPPSGAGDPGWSTSHAPVILEGEQIATLSALRDHSEPFGESETLAFERLASLAVLAWTADRYREERARVSVLRERQRIGDDLHDRVAQILFAAQLALDSALERGGLQPEDADRITKARALLVRGDREIHETIHRLSQPCADSFRERLVATVETVSEDFGVAIHVDVPTDVGDAASALDTPRLDAMLRAVREAATNAAKHAGPCRIAVEARVAGDADPAMVVTIVDDGIGPKIERPGRHRHGLSAARRQLAEHGGDLHVAQRSPVGTTVTAKLSL